MVSAQRVDGQHPAAGCCSSTRWVELELWNWKVGKSLKIGKNQIKSEKSDLISYPTFWQKCQNACSLGQGPASEYLNIQYI